MINEIKVFIPKDLKYREVSWINNSYILVSTLFPDWPDAYELLSLLCDGLTDWEIKIFITDSINRSIQIDIQMGMPYFKNKTLETDQFWLWETFPPKEREQFINIYNKTSEDYTPDIKELVGNKLDIDLIKKEIYNKTKEKEYLIQDLGGRSFKEELRFRLGILY